MKAWTLALIIVMMPVTGWTQATQPTQANSSAGLMSFFDDLFDGADTGTDTGDLVGLLENFLGQAESANIDLGEILGRLEAIDISAVTDEIEALRQEFDLYRYRYAGIADAAYSTGDDLPAFWNLSAACRDTFGAGARLARTGDVVKQLERGTLPVDFASEIIFKSSYPVALGDTLYDTQVNSEVEVDGLLIFSVDQDRFIAKASAASASPGCSLPS